jgi:ligand-binding SRPBCC domain-containing protein
MNCSSSRRSRYLIERPPAYELTSRVAIDAPIDEVFDFFSKPENLGAITPPTMNFRFTKLPPRMGTDARISYRIRVGPAPLTWETGIEAWRPGQGFVDTQLRGPYRCWWHEHRFFPAEVRRTIMEDRVLYAPPLGVLGRLAHLLFIRRELNDIFAYRADAIALRFGRSKSAAAGAA